MQGGIYSGGGLFSQVTNVEEGVEMIKANFDNAYNSPKRPPFEIGGVRVWLNGNLILDKYNVRNIKVDEDIIPVTLLKGENKILIRVDKSYGDRPHWGFCCKFTGTDGGPVKAISY